MGVVQAPERSDMQLVDTIGGFRKALDAERASGRVVGLVPTMGALHEGHLSLVRRAAAECDVVAATVFVNPLQFGPGEDLHRYPRDLERDRSLAADAGAHYLFAPRAEEMYPDQVLTRVSVAALSRDLEGACRPGHLDGVATVVAKLFALAGPCRAYFGEKDHQQLEVVKRMVADLSFPVEVVACPTVRAPDGLALSSRNAYLSAEERRAAPVLYRALLAGRATLEAGERDLESVGLAMREVVEAEPLARLDYAEAREAGPGWRLFVAGRIGTTRLVDNLGVPAPG